MLRVWIASVFIATIAVAAEKGKDFEVLRGCRYIEQFANDGDSFHVRWKGKEYIFRLYYVDSPETSLFLPERVDEQAAYFGITREQAMEIGKKAAEFTRKQLKRDFEARTRWEDAKGASKLTREYAMITTAEGKDLAELLVENGLARIHGFKVEPPSAEAFKRLERLENEARHAKRGAWALSTKKPIHKP